MMSRTPSKRANRAGATYMLPSWLRDHRENPAPIIGPNTKPIENATPINACNAQI